jgi:glycosyltransferase involved in cell wall biosynthesis
VHLLDLAEGVREKGHEVHVYAGGRGVLTDRAMQKNLSVHSLRFLVRQIRPFTDVCGLIELIKTIKRVKPDLVHLHSSKAGILGRLACSFCAVPAVFTAHGWAFTEGVSGFNRLIYQRIEQLMSRFAARVITVSNYDRSLAINRSIASAEKLVTIWNGMPQAECLQRVRRPNEPIRLIMVARFEAQKAQGVLLDALALLPKSGWSAEFVGDGPLLADCVEKARSLNLTDNVVFSGARSDVPARLANSDIFVLLSDWEGLPLTVLEAMRAGLPVVASAVGGVPEAVDEGVTGYLVQNGSPAAISERIQYLIERPALIKTMGASGRRKFDAEFTFAQMCNATLDVYDGVLAEVAE